MLSEQGASIVLEIPHAGNQNQNRPPELPFLTGVLNRRGVPVVWRRSRPTATCISGTTPSRFGLGPSSAFNSCMGLPKSGPRRGAAVPWTGSVGNALPEPLRAVCLRSMRVAVRMYRLHTPER